MFEIDDSPAAQWILSRDRYQRAIITTTQGEHILGPLRRDEDVLAIWEMRRTWNTMLKRVSDAEAAMYDATSALEREQTAHRQTRQAMEARLAAMRKESEAHAARANENHAKAFTAEGKAIALEQEIGPLRTILELAREWKKTRFQQRLLNALDEYEAKR